jgi:hypothetical protein
MGVTVTKDATSSLLKDIKRLTQTQVLVGVPDTTSGRQDPGQPITNASVGYINEFGSPARNIPARPHLIPGVRDAMADTIPRIMQKGAERVLAGQSDAVDKTMNGVGLTAQAAVRRKITDVLSPPLAPRTLAGRQARGHKGETPLIDTGQYLRSITHVLRRGKGK